MVGAKGCLAGGVAVWGAISAASCLVPNELYTPLDTDGSTSASTAAPGSADDSVNPTADVTTVDDPATTFAPSSGPGTDGTAGTSNDWWDPAWRYRRRLLWTAAVAGELFADHFTVRIDLLEDFPEVADNGSDLRFVTDDGEVLRHEIDTWQQGEARVVWVRVPVSSIASRANTVAMYWGNPEALTPPPDSAFDDRFVGVWHMNDTQDASNNENELFEPALVTSPAYIGLGASLGSQIEPLKVEGLDASLLFSGLTFSAWVLVDIGQPDTAMLYSKMQDTPAVGLRISFDPSGEGFLRLTRATVMDPAYNLSAETPNLQGAWHYVTVRYSDPLGAAFFVDGAFVAPLEMPPPTGGPKPEDGSVAVLGADLNGVPPPFFGQLDEVRLSNVERSDAWIALDYASVLGALVVLGDQEMFPGNAGP